MKEQSITKGFAILSIASIVAKLLSLIYVPFLTRIVGNVGMGIYGKTYDIFVFVYALTNVGLQTAISKYVSELDAVGNYKDALRAFKISRAFLLVVGTIFTIVLMLSANFIASMSQTPQMVYPIIFLAPTIMITTVLVTYKGYFQGRSQATPIAIATVIEQVANVFLSLLCAYFLIKKSVSLGVAGGTIGSSAGALMAVLYLIYIYNIYGIEKEAKTKQEPGVRRITGKKIARTLFKYGLPITLSTGLQNLGNIIDMLTVSNRLVDAANFSQSDANALYGYFSTRYKILINVPMVFITSLGYMALPAISRAYALKDKKEIKSKINFSMRVTYLLSIPSAFGLALLSENIYRYIFADSNGYKMMVIGAAMIPLTAIVLMQNVILQSVSQFYYVLFTLALSIVVKFTLNMTLVANPDINNYGAVISGMVAFVISLVLNHFRMKKTLKMKISMLKYALKPLLASIYMGIGIILSKYVISLFIDFDKLSLILGIAILLVIIAIGSFMYLHAIIILGGIKKEDIEEISPKLLRVMPRFLRKNIK